MITNIVTPRLRNSSTNGTRHIMELNPDVRRHLAELNTLLGTPAFSVVQTAGDLGEFKQKAADLRRLVQEAEVQSLEADNDVVQKTEAATLARINASVAGELFTRSTARAEIREQLEADFNVKKQLHEAKEAEAENARTAATEHRDRLRQLKADEEALSDRFMDAVAVAVKGNQGFRHDNDIHFNLEDQLNKPLLAKKTTADKWDDNGILNFIVDKQDPSQLSIADCIDQLNELSNLKNNFLQYLNSSWNVLDDNQKAVLNPDTYPNISDYLVAYGYFIKGITDVTAMFNFVRTHRFGAQAVVNYAVVSTARFMIQKASLSIEEVNGKTYNDDDHPVIKRILDNKISLHEDVYGPEIEKTVKDFIANDRETDLIDLGLKNLKIDDLPAAYYPLIIGYIRRSSVAIDEDNINYFLPIFISRAVGTADEDVAEEETVDTTDTNEAFEVEFIEDDKTTIKTNVSNILCAAQLFSSMIMDTELDIFNLTNFFTNNYLTRNRLDFEDRYLQQNLQQFVFSNRFVDPKSKERMDRTDPAERQHFYRQVFNYGTGPVPQGLIVNTKFPKLWGQLIPAVKKYLDDVSSSLSEDTFVSKGNVMQIVSGMKTNVSAGCTSISKIISPVINAEWNFIITKILGHPEVVKQVSPNVGSWKGVAETLYAEMKQRTIDASLVYDKARLSYKILVEVANYEPREFEQQDKFYDFCSLVIELDNLNQSMAQDASELPQEEPDNDPAAAAENEAYASAGIPKMPAFAPGGNSKGGWDQ